MTNSLSTISTDMENSLQYLASISEKPNKTDEDTIKLQVLGKKLLEDINQSIPSLNVSTQLYLKDISEILKNGIEKKENWNKLPSVTAIRLNVSELRSISNIVSEKLDSICVDIFSMLSELLKYQREANSVQANQRMVSNKAKIDLAAKEFESKKNSINSEYASSMISAAVQIGVASIQGIISTKSMISSTANLKKSKDNINNNYEFEKLNKEGAIVSEKIKLSTEELNIVIKDKTRANIDNSKVSRGKLEETNNKIKKYEDRINENKIKKTDFDNRSLVLKNTIEINNNEISSKNQKISAIGEISRNIGGLMNGVAGCFSGWQKNLSRTSELDAEIQSRRGGLMNESAQSQQESIRNVQELMKDFIQRIQNIIQTFDSAVSNTASKV